MLYNKHYVNPTKPHHKDNVRQFLEAVDETKLEYFWPNYDNAPWHVQARVNGYIINFWPCSNRANIDREKSVYGKGAIIRLIQDARKPRAKGEEVLDDDGV